jgi:hypothetical protein
MITLSLPSGSGRSARRFGHSWGSFCMGCDGLEGVRGCGVGLPCSRQLLRIPGRLYHRPGDCRAKVWGRCGETGGHVIGYWTARTLGWMDWTVLLVRRKLHPQDIHKTSTSIHKLDTQYIHYIAGKHYTHIIHPTN